MSSLAIVPTEELQEIYSVLSLLDTSFEWEVSFGRNLSDMMMMLRDAGKEVMVDQSVKFARVGGIMCAPSASILATRLLGMSVSVCVCACLCDVDVDVCLHDLVRVRVLVSLCACTCVM
jgi:hypothetical protein